MYAKVFALGLLFVAGLALLFTQRASDSPQAAASVQEGTTLAADLTLQEMTAQSDLILTGECVGTRSVWIDRTLVTLATVAVDEAIKGDPGSMVEVALPGGIDSNRRVPIAMTYPGAPQMQANEEVFLFLTRGEGMGDAYVVSGFAQGKYSIVENERGEKHVSRDLTRVRLERGPGVRRGQAESLPLQAFKQRVRGHLR